MLLIDSSVVVHSGQHHVSAQFSLCALPVRSLRAKFEQKALGLHFLPYFRVQFGLLSISCLILEYNLGYYLLLALF